MKRPIFMQKLQKKLERLETMGWEFLLQEDRYFETILAPRLLQRPLTRMLFFKISKKHC